MMVNAQVTPPSSDCNIICTLSPSPHTRQTLFFHTAHPPSPSLYHHTYPLSPQPVSTGQNALPNVIYSAAFSKTNPSFVAAVGKQASSGLLLYSNNGGASWLTQLYSPLVAEQVNDVDSVTDQYQNVYFLAVSKLGNNITTILNIISLYRIYSIYITILLLVLIASYKDLTSSTYISPTVSCLTHPPSHPQATSTTPTTLVSSSVKTKAFGTGRSWPNCRSNQRLPFRWG